MWQPQSFYNQYVLRSPIILSGETSVRGLYHYPAARIAVIHGRSFSDQELFVSTFSKRAVCFIRRSWDGEPDYAGLQESIRQIEEFAPDTIIAIGGGSVIDGSKLCRLFYEFPFFHMGETRLSGENFRTRFIAIPTTVGSGAEVSSAAVFIDHDRNCKDMVVAHELQPDVVVYDQRYVENTPDRLLVASALDAMAHILEGYVSKINNSFSDILAEKGLRLLHNELQKMICDERKMLDYGRLQYAGYIGGLVQNHCIVGAAHAVAHQLADYGYSHGEAVSLLLNGVISLNARDGDSARKYDYLLQESGFENVDDLTGFIRALCHVAGIDGRRRDLGDLLLKLSQNRQFCENIRSDRGGKGNPVEITDEYIAELSGSVSYAVFNR